MKFILAKKLNMTQVFTEDGKVVPATVLVAQKMIVSQIKDVSKDGYNAVQVGTGTKNKTNKPRAGHIKGIENNNKNFAHIKEFRLEDITSLNRGDSINLDSFVAGDVVTISGISKGKGFQGVVKRHGFGGGPRTHGQKHSEREPGSIGGGGRAGGRVIKGMRMAGRMGGDKITVKNLKVLNINLDDNTMIVSGAVPGRRGTLLEIKTK